MEKRRPFKADIDKGGLHPWEDATDLSLVDVADQPPAPGPLDQDFLKDPIFNDRDSGLGRRDIDEDFIAHAF